MTLLAHREVHFWTEQLSEPPCGTLDDHLDWSHAVEDVTCEACLEALAGDSGDLTSPTARAPRDGGEHPPP